MTDNNVIQSSSPAEDLPGDILTQGARIFLAQIVEIGLEQLRTATLLNWFATETARTNAVTQETR